MSSEDVDGIYIPENMYAYGSHVVMKHRRAIPISVDKFWSAFDDYLTFQKSLFLHEDTRLEPGPINGPGATISFMYRGSRTYETLDVKDDEKKIWKISLPRANAMFSFYEATISLYEGECGKPPEAQAVLDGVFIEKDDNTRRAYIDSISRVWVTRIRELCEYVLDRDGLRQKHDFILKCPISDVWKVVGNWNDVSWVTGAVDVKVQNAVQNTRTITLESGGEVFEYEKLNSDEEKRLVYIVEKSTGSLPVQLYRGDLQLIPPLNMPDLTIVSYNITLLLNDGLDNEKTMNQIALGLRSNFTRLQKMFDKTVS